MSTNERETQVVLDWIDYIQASIDALGAFKRSIQDAVLNDNRELSTGDFGAALRQLSEVVGDGYAGQAVLDIDALVAVVTGEGLPQEPVYANDETREAARLDAVFGPGSTMVLEVRFMPPQSEVDWLDLEPHLVKVRKEHIRNDVFDFYLRWLVIQDKAVSEIRYNELGSLQGSYMDVSK